MNMLTFNIQIYIVRNCFSFACLASKCQTMACNCWNTRIPCSEFCGCQDSCQNRWNLRDIEIDDCIGSDYNSENGDNDFDDKFI